MFSVPYLSVKKNVYGKGLRYQEIWIVRRIRIRRSDDVRSIGWILILVVEKNFLDSSKLQRKMSFDFCHLSHKSS